VKRLAFASPYCLIDYSSGAAVAVRDGLELLARAGFRCEAFCGARLDFGEEVCLEETLSELGLPWEGRQVAVGPHRMKLLFTRQGRVPITIFRNQSTRRGPTPQEAPAFLAAFGRFLDTTRPDVMLTYGGDRLTDATIRQAHRRRIIAVFALHNLAYRDPAPFRNVDYVTVPSEFAKDYYRQQLGLDCRLVPNVMLPERVKVSDRRPKYLAFVNPQPLKGLFVFARIAERLARRRSDIPILIVESRTRARALERTGVDLSWAENLFYMPNTPDPRQFYAVTKVLIMPSVTEESFGLAAAEAMTNGIPVVVSDRGALPETVGEGGIVLDIPARYTVRTTEVPTGEEVEPWVEAIIRLWDDGAFYRQQSDKSLAWSQRWSPERLRPLYVDFLRNVQPQPGPPIVPKLRE